MTDHPFYVIQVKTGKERRVQAHLERQLKTCWVELPMVICYPRGKDGKRVKSKRLCFDGYVFISADLSDAETLAIVNAIPDVLSVFHKHPMGPEETKRAFKRNR